MYVEHCSYLLPRSRALCMIDKKRDSALFVFDEGHRCDGEVVTLDGHIGSLHAFLHLETVLKRTTLD